MSGVVFIVSIPTESYEKCLLKKEKKKVTINELHTVILSEKQSSHYSVNSMDQDFVQINYSNEEKAKHKENQSMEAIHRNILQQLNIVNSTWCRNEGDNYLQVIFPVESSDRCEEILEIFKENHIGYRFNSIVSVLPCTVQFHGHGTSCFEQDSQYWEEQEDEKEGSCDKNGAWNRFLSSVRARLSVAQVVENIKIHATLTFNFVSLILLSTIVCAIGLVENNNVYLLSSMLICPMMGPVMAATFGSVIQHKRLLKIGVQNELLGLGIATVVGFCYGSLICIITDKYGNQTWPTYEMLSRGELRSLWVGCIIAVVSGAAMALGILSDNIASLVGVAISTSLTPPAVNAGLLWSLASIYYIKGNETTRYYTLTQTNYYSKNYGTELFTLGAVSICLTFINIACIYVGAIAIFKIKEVAPMASKGERRKRFWNHDIKIARNYNKTLTSEDGSCMITKLSEEIAQLQNTKFNNDRFYHSTELARENLKLNIKRSEYTWSPSMNVLDKSRAINELYENLSKCMKVNSSRVLNFNVSKSKAHQRRLSQIFIPVEDKLNTIKETGSEKSPITDELCDSSSKSKSTLGNKKFTVTPCDLDSLKP